ncbi:MAG: hypothetical protein WCR98_02045 [Saccharofermentanales bacterium]|jgi:hypothetical protein
MKIIDLIEDYTIPTWENYPNIEGFRVLIRMPDVPKTYSMMARAWREERKEIGQADSDIPVDIGISLVRYAVSDWHGLRVSGLRILAPGYKVGGDPEQEIPFSGENLDSLLRISGSFFIWVLGKVRERQEAAAQEAEEVKNL